MKPKKIDVFINGEYAHSTMFYRTCKDAKKAALNIWKALLDADSSGKDTGLSAARLSRYQWALNHADRVKARFDHDHNS